MLQTGADIEERIEDSYGQKAQIRGDEEKRRRKEEGFYQRT